MCKVLRKWPEYSKGKGWCDDDGNEEEDIDNEDDEHDHEQQQQKNEPRTEWAKAQEWKGM